MPFRLTPPVRRNSAVLTEEPMARTSRPLTTADALTLILLAAVASICMVATVLIMLRGPHGSFHSPATLGWALAAGAAGALGALVLMFGFWRRWLSPAEALQDMLVLGLLALSIDPAMQVWQAPKTLAQLGSLNLAVAVVLASGYQLAQGFAIIAGGRHLSPLAGLGVLAAPYLFNALLIMESPTLLPALAAQTGLSLTVAAPLGRFAVLATVNEFVGWYLCRVQTGRGLWDARVHALLLASAACASLTPEIAGLGALPALAAWPRPLAAAASTAASVAALAGLWGQTYLVTGMIMDSLHSRKPTWYWDKGHYSGGFLRGAVYATVYMGLIQAASLALTNPAVRRAMAAAPLAVAVTAGVLLFPLIVTIIESFDGSDPFFGRLRARYRDHDLYLRGAVVGLGVGLAFGGLPGGKPLTQADGLARFGFGVAVGALAYAGVDILRDVLSVRQGNLNGRMQPWKVYALGALLGGAVGGAIAWYVDARQAAAVAEKFQRYAAVYYPAAGLDIKPYMIWPLFSKWGEMNLGLVPGGAPLLYAEALSGVINWSIAAPLFSINLVLLTAIITRSTQPLHELFTRRGMTGVMEQLVRVLRWGLWMAPIIYSLLKVAPEPTWYNQDGAVRSLVAIYRSMVMDGPAFKAWSLHMFVLMLVYDWFRILLWFDHMGLRVATLVNLSFVGGDALDEKAAHFVGHSARARFIPEGIRRFGTWAPLLIPFFLPRGADWDFAWNTSASMRAALGPQNIWPGLSLLAAFVFASLGIGLVTGMRQPRREGMRVVPTGGEDRAMEPDFDLSQTHSLGNGLYNLELRADGRGYSRVFRGPVQGYEIDLTRRPTDPLLLRGKFFFVQDLDVAEPGPRRTWSIGYQPMPRAEAAYECEAVGADVLRLCCIYAGVRAEALVRLAGDDTAELWTVRLTNLENRPRRLELASYQELAVNGVDAYSRHPYFSAMHVGTTFVRRLSAILAQQRLLKAPGQRRATEVAFHAAAPGAGARLTGYEDSRPTFIGFGTLAAPQALRRPAGGLDAEGLSYSFDPVASLRLAVDLGAAGQAQDTVEVRFADGYAATAQEASEAIARYLGIPDIEAEAAAQAMRVERPCTTCDLPVPPDLPAEVLAARATNGMFRFSDDGTELRAQVCTPRPWAHLMGNPLGYGTVLTNNGQMASFMGNSQQNAITPFSFDSIPSQTPGQLIYLLNMDTGAAESPTFLPFRKDFGQEVTFGRGYARFAKQLETAVSLEMTAFVLPDYPAEMRLVTLRNTGDAPVRYRVAPYAQMLLGEAAHDTRGKLESRYDRELGALYFSNPANDFQKGWAFVAGSLPTEAYETVRRRILGGADRDLTCPYMLEHGVPDASQPDDGFRAAGLVHTLAVPAGGEASYVLVMGQAHTLDQARELCRELANLEAAQAGLERVRRFWTEALGELQVETNDPAFDRLVNHWLPYQILVSRLWGRAGHHQRSGAFGFRDQLQDVLPLLYLHPDMARRQILLHAGQQFPEGDVLQWWHLSWEGRTGIGSRNRASDPHLWLPYLVSQYLDATGDASILDEKLPYLEGKPIPEGHEGILFAPRPSLAQDTLYDHCRRAIDFTLGRMGQNGLPLMGTGDWNDGLSQVGPKGRGESVWLGFFLYDVLTRFAPVARRRRDDATAEGYERRAKAVRQALDTMWRGDRYARATMDDGRELIFADALTSAWPVISGAAMGDKGREAMDTGIRDLSRDNLMVLLAPPFTEDADPYPGRIADYPPGVRENGGQYSHGSSWLVDALVRLADDAADHGRSLESSGLLGRAVDVWTRISPLAHMRPQDMEVYGLPPHQQAADIYYAHYYAGRGGWSWYTGAAGRMLTAAYALLGLRMEAGRLILRPDAFNPKGRLTLRRVLWQGKEQPVTKP